MVGKKLGEPDDCAAFVEGASPGVVHVVGGEYEVDLGFAPGRSAPVIQ